MTATPVRAAIAAAVAAASLIGASAALARHGTTAPGAQVHVRILVTAKTLFVGGGASAPRGEIVAFRVTNSTKDVARISFLGLVHGSIAPDHAATFVVPVDRRGAFPIVARLAPGRRLRQTFVVY